MSCGVSSGSDRSITRPATSLSVSPRLCAPGRRMGERRREPWKTKRAPERCIMFDMPHELLQKHEDNDLPLLLEQTVSRYLRSDAQIIALEPLAIGKHGGMSGAALARYRVTYHSLDGEANAVTLITKRAHLRERKVLALLSAQRQAVPFSHTLDLLTDEPRLLCQQDLSGDPDEQVSPDIVQQEAERLARIHSANLGQAEALSWLPRADRSYLEEVILADFHRQLAKAMERPGFVAKYADIARRWNRRSIHSWRRWRSCGRTARSR